MNRTLLAVAFALLTFSTVQGQVTPPGLSPGDTFRYVFVTSTETDALSTDIGDYNDFVNVVAANNPNLAGINFNAIGSTEAVDAIDNTGTATTGGANDAPIFMLDGTQVATGNLDLWDGMLINGIELDENLNTINDFVWTGSFDNGTDINDFELGSGNLVRRGFAGDTFSNWVFDSVGNGGVTANMYAISDVLTVVPEPTSGSMLAIATLGLIGFRRRRNG